MVKTFGLDNFTVTEGFNDIDSTMNRFSDTIMYVLKERCYHTCPVMGTHNFPNNNIY